MCDVRCAMCAMCDMCDVCVYVCVYVCMRYYDVKTQTHTVRQ